MWKNIFVLVLFFCICKNIHAQRIQSTVTDSLDVPLVGATIVLISSQDSIMAGFALTDEKGKFKLNDIEQGEYSLQVTYLGYAPYSNKITLEKEDLTLDAIILKVADNRLSEVVIEGEIAPIVVKDDTLVYNASAFETQAHEVVEDLLRKMPGVEIESDGSIIAQGEKVEQVLVDGKQFFDGNTKTATKNLPAAAIDNIKFYDKQSESSEFTGIKDGQEKKTMDLELKEDYKTGQFGKVRAGIGIDESKNERYDAGLNANRFGENIKMSAIANFYNAQQSNKNSGIGRMSRSLSTNGGIGFPEKKDGGLNLNFNPSKKISLSGSYNINSSKNNLSTLTQSENYISENSSFINYSERNSSNAGLGHTLSSNATLRIDSTQEISVRGSLSLSNSNNTSNSTEQTIDNNLINQSLSLNQSAYLSDSHNISGSVNYRKKIGEKKRILVMESFLTCSTSDSSQDLEVQTEFQQNPLENFDLNQLREDRNDGLRVKNKISYAEPFNNQNHLEINYVSNFTDDLLINNTFDRTEQDVLIINDELTQENKKDFNTHSIGIAYHQKFEKINLKTEGTFQRTILKGDYSDISSKISKKGFYFIPSASLNYIFNTSQKIKLQYSSSVREPSILQLQPFVNNFDPLNVFIGNPNLKPEFNHSIRLNFSHFDRFNFTSFFWSANLNLGKNRIIYQSFIDDQLITTTSPINVNGDAQINTNANFSSPIRPLHIKINTILRYGFTKNNVFINDLLSKAKTHSTNISFTIGNRNKKFFDTSLGTQISYNNTSYNSDSDLSQNFINQSLTHSLSITGIPTWFFNSQFHVTSYRQDSNNRSFNDQQEVVPTWSCSLSKYFLENNAIELKLSLHDILNRNVSVQQFNSLNSTVYTETESLGRYFLFSLSYNFRAF